MIFVACLKISGRQTTTCNLLLYIFSGFEIIFTKDTQEVRISEHYKIQEIYIATHANQWYFLYHCGFTLVWNVFSEPDSTRRILEWGTLFYVNNMHYLYSLTIARSKNQYSSRTDFASTRKSILTLQKSMDLQIYQTVTTCLGAGTLKISYTASWHTLWTQSMFYKIWLFNNIRLSLAAQSGLVANVRD